MPVDNLYGPVSAAMEQEVFTELLRGRSFRVERIVSRGQCSPQGFWYEQAEHEWVVLLKGAAGLQFEQQPQPLVLREGDYLNIPAGVRHRVAWTAADQDTVWLAIFYS